MRRRAPLYDAGYVTVTADFKFHVSAALCNDIVKGSPYYDLERV